MNLFYQPSINNDTLQIIFDKEESRHIAKVLRKKEGDSLYITNGKGLFAKSHLISTNPKQCIATILEKESKEGLPYSLHIAVAPTKLNDRYEWFLEKATEIGITEITPIICDHSERKVIKKERYEKIIVSAMKQSLKYHKPILHDAILFKDFVTSEKTKVSQKFIAHCEEDDLKKTLISQLTKNEKYLILIGPEGDFSNNEIALAKSHDFIPISLGKSRLRTETAALVACNSVSFIQEIV